MYPGEVRVQRGGDVWGVRGFVFFGGGFGGGFCFGVGGGGGGVGGGGGGVGA